MNWGPPTPLPPTAGGIFSYRGGLWGLGPFPPGLAPLFLLRHSAGAGAAGCTAQRLHSDAPFGWPDGAASGCFFGWFAGKRPIERAPPQTKIDPPTPFCAHMVDASSILLQHMAWLGFGPASGTTRREF